MTRDEAVLIARKVGSDRPWDEGEIDLLVELGLLKLETTADKDRIAAAGYLKDKFTEIVRDSGCTGWNKITESGAYEILDILTKSGFKITRELT